MRKLMMITIITTLFTACPGSNTSNNNSNNSQNSKFNFEKFYAEFQAKKTAWEDLGIDHYKYTVIHRVSAPLWTPSVTVMVFPDERSPLIIAIDNVDVSEDLVAQNVAEWYVEWFANKIEDWYPEWLSELERRQFIPLTITQLFNSLEWRLQGTEHESPYFEAYLIEYDKDYYFPEYFVKRNKPGVTGGASGLEITAFEDLREQE